MSHDLVLFDLDGTLVDSAPAITSCMSQALADFGYGYRPDELGTFVGPPFAVSLAGIGIEGEKQREIVERYREIYGAGPMYDSPVFPGVRTVLEVLHRDGDKLAVATSKPQQSARQIVKRHRLHELLSDGIDGVFGADPTNPRDSKGDVIARALAYFGISPAEVAHAVMVGDRLHDVHGARENGLSAIGVRWGYAQQGELENAGATVVVDSPSELVEQIRRVLNRS